jgi:uncharacterized protein YdeI (YjbR/CyaY-like superfamily)
MIPTERFTRVEIHSVDELRTWLSVHHGQSESVWLVTWLKRPGAPYVSRSNVLDELLCFGWIDGVARKLDEHRTMQLISPRRTDEWTQHYRDRVARLEKAGRMSEHGRAVVERAKKRGTWFAAREVDALVVPEDLVVALRNVRGAQGWFDGAAPSYRRNALRWLAKAKTKGTRQRRVIAIAQAAGESRKLPQL